MGNLDKFTGSLSRDLPGTLCEDEPDSVGSRPHSNLDVLFSGEAADLYPGSCGVALLQPLRSHLRFEPAIEVGVVSGKVEIGVA